MAAFWLAGRTSRTALPRGHRQPLALATGVLFALLALKSGVDWTLPALLLFAAMGLLVADVDLRHRLLPNHLIRPFLLGAVTLLALAAAMEGQRLTFSGAVLGSATMFVIFLFLTLITPKGIGMGDAKLSAVVGFYAGYAGGSAWLTALLGGFVLAATASLVLLALRVVDRKSKVPFGPSMIAAATAAILMSWPTATP